MQTMRCPDLGQLRHFAVGNLSGLVFQRLADHVADCPSCAKSLARLDHEPDELVANLRGLDDGSPAAATTAVPSDLLKAVRTAFPPAANGGPSAVLDTGRQLVKQLEQGPYRVGKFELLAELGVGAFGHVFRARDTELDRTVAVKVQRSTAGGDHDADRFLREARSAAQLKHPGIVAVFETGQTDDGGHFLVEEFIDGVTLESWLDHNRPTWRETAELIAQLAEALHYAHTQGVIHRDVKPSNVIMDLGGRPHIMDFGLAKRETADSTMTDIGQVMGTPAYMSPEQAQGDSHQVDKRSDVYSLGVILYEMLTREPPFAGNGRMLLLQVLEDEPRPPRQLVDRVPRDLETICLKAMAKSPTRRYNSADAFRADLQRFLQNEPIHARPIGPLERLTSWCYRYPWAVVMFGLIAAGAGIGLYYLSGLSEYFVHRTALQSARMEAMMLDEMWRFYSEVVERIDRKKTPIPITENYRLEHGAIPLPATFAIDMGQRISGDASGMEVRIYSRYPWPDREDGGPRDDFESQALRWLEQARKPSGNAATDADPVEFTSFTEVGGRPVLLYATARHMEQSCLGCHNDAKSRSPKKDWKVGDVAGVMKIVHPLDEDIAHTQRGLRGAFVLVGCASLLLVGVAVALVRGSRAAARARRTGR